MTPEEDYNQLKIEISHNFEYFYKTETDILVENCEKIIDKYQLKTLDSIQLAASLHVVSEIDAFICCDMKLLKAAVGENLKTINPVTRMPDDLS